MGRGDVRAAILVLLGEEPRNGYGLMQEIEQRSQGAWRPSPGSVYPALSQLEDEGLVRSTESEGRKQFELTDQGRTYVEERRDELGSPWEAASGDVREGAFELRDLIWQLGAAAHQVAGAGRQGPRGAVGGAPVAVPDPRRRRARAARRGLTRHGGGGAA
jgi:DNA-binding PadR family transcriptional regulator